MKKSIIIALGGTGTAVVEDLRKRLKIYAGTDSPPECKFIYADTDALNNAVFRERPGESCQMTLDPTTVAKCRQENSDLANRIEIAKWMDMDRMSHLTHLNSGADGVRAYGRLALLAGAELAKLIGLIQNAQAQLLALNVGDADDNASLRIFVVASAGGGSGSGFFIDMGYLTRMHLQNARIEHIGIVAVAPTGFQLTPGEAPGKKQNSAALLDELDYFTRPDAVFTANYNGQTLPEAVGRDRPYQYCYIVSPMSGHGALSANPAVAVDIMTQRISDWIFLRITGPGEVGSRQSDFTNNTTNKFQDKQGFPNAFCTFGASVRQFPAQKYLDESIGKAMTRVADRWLKVGVADSLLTALWKPDYDQLVQELGLPQAHIQNNNNKRIMAEDQLYQKLVAPREIPGQPAPPLPIAQVQSANDAGSLSNQFNYQPGSPVNPGMAGYFAGTVRNNQSDFLSGNGPAQGFEPRLGSLLEQIAFDNQKGPKVAILLIDALKTNLNTEAKFIGGCLTTINSSAAPTATNAPVKRASDPLLGPWQSTLKTSSATSLSPSLSAEKNRLIEKELLTAKKAIYDQVLSSLEISRKRLETLDEYLSAWRASWGGQADTSWRRECPPGVLADRNVDAIVDEKIERFSVVPTPYQLEPIKKVYQEAEFVTNPPHTRDKQVRFVPFKPIEGRVIEKLKSEYKDNGERMPATDTILGESAVRVMDITNRHEWAADSEALVKEAWPLLQLNLADDDYAHLLPPNPDGFPTPVEHYWYINLSVADPESDERFRTAIRGNHVNINTQGGVPVRSNAKSWPQDIEPSLAGLVYLRGSFPTRIISGLTPADRLTLLGDNAFLHYSRADVIGPVPPKALAEAEARLLILDTLRLHSSLPPGLAAIVDGTRYRITYHDNQGAVNGHVNAVRWNAAAHELAVKGKLCLKIDEVITNYLNNSLNKGVIAGAIAQLRADINRALANRNPNTHNLTWADLTPEDVLRILERAEAQYKLQLSDDEVRSARRLYLGFLTLVNDLELRGQLAANPVSGFYTANTQVTLPHHTTDTKAHTLAYMDSTIGLPHQETIRLSKLDPNVAARTLAANITAYEALQRNWNALVNLPGGSGGIANALVKMIGVLQRLPIRQYCSELDMFGLEATIDRPLICELAQPILPDHIHPWAVKDESNMWRCGNEACGFRLGPVKPGLDDRCPNPTCKWH